jgi:hypothetical protein
MQGISWLAEELSASQEGLSYMGFVIWGQVVVRLHQFFPVSVIPPMLRIYSSTINTVIFKQYS